MTKGVTVVYNNAAKYARLFDLRQLQAADARVMASYDALLEPHAARLSGELDPIAATAYLTKARGIIQGQLTQAVQAFSPLQWLTYLRQVPSIYWLGALPTTALFDTSLAEVLSARSATSAKYRRSEPHPYPLTTFVAKKVADYTVGVRYLSQIFVNLRLAGKSAAFVADRPVLRAVTTDEQRTAIDLFDARVAADAGMFLARTGSVVAAQGAQSDETSIAGIFRTLTAPWQGSWEKTFAAETLRTGREPQFVVDHFDLADLAALNARLGAVGLRWWTDNAAVLAGFLRALRGQVEGRLSIELAVGQFGWLLTSRTRIQQTPAAEFDDCRTFAQRIFPGTPFPSDMPSLYAAVAQISGSTWPLLHGPAIRSDGDTLCVDLHAATHMLQDAARFWTTGGPDAVIKGHDFERGVQALIDASPWAPPPQLRKHVGAKLHRDGNLLTDLDALGFKDGRVLVVSCKSLIFSDAYSEGIFQTVRAMETKIDEALEKWRDVTAFLQSNPRCLDGFDFSLCEIVSLVCVPLPPFVKLGAATELAAAGLLRVVSVMELVKWITH